METQSRSSAHFFCIGKRVEFFLTRAPGHACASVVWLDRWETALDESDKAYAEVEQARTTKQSSMSAGRDAETDWVELFVRLRRYVASRAKRSDTARVQEGKALLAPLLDVLRQLSAQAATRATRRRNANEQEAPNG